MRSRTVLPGAVFSVLLITGLVIGQPPVLAAGSPPPRDPVAEINTPTNGQYLGDLTQVEGSANCKRFSHWTLSYKAKEDVGWIELTQSSSAAKNDLLLAWDTSDLEEGWYDLRLAVYSVRDLEAETIVPVNMTYVPCGDINGDFVVDPVDLDYFAAWLWEEGPPPFQMRAVDVDLSGQVDVLDLVYLSNYIYNEGPAPCAWTIGDLNHDWWVDEGDVDYCADYLWNGGPAPRPLESMDVDCSDQIDVLDCAYLVDYLYNDGPEPGLACYVRGDFNHVGSVNWDDVIYFRNWLFTGGPQPMPLVSADVDCSDQVDILDLDYLIDYIIRGGPPPCP